MRTFDDSTVDHPVSPELTERRYVYNGESREPLRAGAPRGNRPIKRRKRSPFNIILLLIMVSGMIVVHVWNKIGINRLAVEVNDLQVQYDKIAYTNEVFRAEINKKSSLERIVKMASERMGMTAPKEQPVWFTMDEERRIVSGH